MRKEAGVILRKTLRNARKRTVTRNENEHDAKPNTTDAFFHLINDLPPYVLFVAPESARKIAAKNRSPMPTGIGGSFQLANSASPLGVIDSASAPTARMKGRAQNKIGDKVLRREKRAQNQRSQTKQNARDERRC